jgi:hypothetical protein
MDEQFEVELSVEQTTEAAVVAHKPSMRNVADSDSATLNDDDVIVQKRGLAGSEGVRVERGGDDPRSASADIDEAGVVNDTIAGRASPKELSELRAAQTLVQRLDANGEKWQAAQMRTGHEDGVDCIALGDDGDKLQMQMTTPERSAWAALARSANFDRNEDVDRSVEAVRAAMAHKKSRAHPSIVLVIDATDSPRYALRSVAERFRQTYAHEANACGFAAVWLVGPVAEMVYRLDAH